jgi:hypothetical protein
MHVQYYLTFAFDLRGDFSLISHTPEKMLGRHLGFESFPKFPKTNRVLLDF